MVLLLSVGHYKSSIANYSGRYSLALRISFLLRPYTFTMMMI